MAQLLAVGALLLSTPLLAYGPAQPNWVVVNDSVMGGVSTSRVESLEGGGIRFRGQLSLDNNGGFASVRSNSPAYALQPRSGLILKVRGDGRTYKVNLRTPGGRMAFSYQSTFTTTPGEVSEHRLSLASFRPVAFGRYVPNAPELDPTQVTSLGFTLSDGRPGSFSIDILEVAQAPPERVELEDARGLIGMAISKGVPLFNRGDADACADIYELAARSMLLMSHQKVPPDSKEKIAKAVEEATPLPAIDRAWALRRLLDEVFLQLSFESPTPSK